MRALFKSILLVFCLCFIHGLAWASAPNLVGALSTAQPLCPNPSKNLPQLAFTMASYGPGSLDRQCETSLKAALSKGFTAVSLVPARVFDGHTVISQGTVSPEELTRCLDKIWIYGFNLIYQPHLESDYLIDPKKPVVWRAEFDYPVDLNYDREFFDPVFIWLELHKDALKLGQRQVDFTIASELEKSTTKYPETWSAFVLRLHSRLSTLGLDGLVRIGFNPNWWPMPYFDGTDSNCRNFQNFVTGLDYVGPSLYGDWSRMYKTGSGVARGRVQVDENYAELMGRLTYYPASKCSVPQMRGKPFAIGEIGFGGDVNHAEQAELAMAKKPEFLLKRRAIYSNLLEWARTQVGAGMSHINVWTSGVFDPVGVSPGEKVEDPDIAQMFRDYSSARCQ